jgi:hypothetical protein
LEKEAMKRELNPWADGNDGHTVHIASTAMDLAVLAGYRG